MTRFGIVILPPDMGARQWLPAEPVEVPVLWDGDPTLPLGMARVYSVDEGLFADVTLVDPEHELYDHTYSVHGRRVNVHEVDGEEVHDGVDLLSLGVKMKAPIREGGEPT